MIGINLKSKIIRIIEEIKNVNTNQKIEWIGLIEFIIIKQQNNNIKEKIIIIIFIKIFREKFPSPHYVTTYSIFNKLIKATGYLYSYFY